MTPPRIIGLGTHHKTGTVWMDTVFRKMARKLSFARVVVKRTQRRDLSWIPDEGRCFAMSWSSNFSDAVLERDDARFIHVVRDPRDILISGLFYHLRTDNERFLHRQRDDLGGKTYQQHLRSLPTLYDQFIFELEEKHTATLVEMRNWNRDAANTFEWRYEDLINDTDCALFEQGMRFVGIEGDDLAIAKRVFWNNSLFGGLAKESGSQAGPPLAGHVRSGKAGQWVKKLPPEIAKVYLDRFGDDLIALGYEKDRSWLSKLAYEGPDAATQIEEVVG